MQGARPETLLPLQGHRGAGSRCMAGTVLYKHAARRAGRISGAIWPLPGRLADLVQQQSRRRVPGDCTGTAASGGRLSVLTVTHLD
jgi:hypothetical protein